MIKITYINGDVQHINVTGDFFTVTLAEKNSNGVPKKVKMTPIEKAEDVAFDLAVQRNSQVASIELFYPNNPRPKIKTFRLVDTPEMPEKAKPTKSFIRELKKMKKEWRHRKHSQRWVWQF